METANKDVATRAPASTHINTITEPPVLATHDSQPEKQSEKMVTEVEDPRGRASLSAFNSELALCRGGLRVKRIEVDIRIRSLEKQKGVLESERDVVMGRLEELGVNLNKDRRIRDEYDAIMRETEEAYVRILESSETLLHVLKQESSLVGRE